MHDGTSGTCTHAHVLVRTSPSGGVFADNVLAMRRRPMAQPTLQRDDAGCWA